MDINMKPSCWHKLIVTKNLQFVYCGILQDLHTTFRKKDTNKLNEKTHTKNKNH